MSDIVTEARPSQEIIVMSEAPPNDRQGDNAVESMPSKGLTLLQVLATSDGGEAAKMLNEAFKELVNTLVSLDMHEGVRKSKGPRTRAR